ncbi:SDR family oxidoreductase [Gottschalkiaceae bacterium SANA]|nr:SDR family oxidoreductase [Gottschalkiaceae bacterium SANA]
MEKIMVITGGSSGLGLCIAQKLVMNGKHVCLIGRNSEKLQDAVKGLQLLNAEVVVKAVSMDISQEDQVKEFYKELGQNYQVECLFNVAGLGIFGQAKEINEVEIDQVINSNLKGMIVMTSGVLKQMEVQGGKIANVISTAGLKGKSNESLYCAAKWGARGFTEALKAEYKGRNILVYGIYPGGMKTNFWDKSPSFDTKKFMDPKEVAGRIVDMVTHESIYISEMVIERQ